MFAQESAYAYDANGNLTKDLNKNIVDIQYNSLNLPSRIVFKNGDNISHVYSADVYKRQLPKQFGTFELGVLLVEVQEVTGYVVGTHRGVVE